MDFLTPRIRFLSLTSPNSPSETRLREKEGNNISRVFGGCPTKPEGWKESRAVVGHSRWKRTPHGGSEGKKKQVTLIAKLSPAEPPSHGGREDASRTGKESLRSVGKKMIVRRTVRHLGLSRDTISPRQEEKKDSDSLIKKGCNR